MIVALTGSTGFLGSHLVPMLVAKGHQVVALVRPGAPKLTCPWLQLPGVRVVAASLDDAPVVAAAFSGCQAVIHVLAALTGDESAQRAVNVQGTQAVLSAMDVAGVHRLVGMSSLSVYAWDTLAAGDTLTESTPLETRPERRDVYARCKREQDALFTAFGQTSGRAAVVLRPGIFYGAKAGVPDPSGGLWNFALGRALGGRAWLLMGPMGRHSDVPMVHIEDVSLGVVAALALLERPDACGAQVFNLVEAPAPRRDELVAALNRLAPARRLLTVPWPLHLGLARVATALAGWLPGGAARLPGLLHSSSLWARHAPVHVDGTRARQLLGWQPRHQAIGVLQALPPTTPDPLP